MAKNRIRVPAVACFGYCTNRVTSEGKPMRQAVFVEPETTVEELIEIFRKNKISGEIHIIGMARRA